MFGLSFLNAGILFLTLATVIPLLIHLFVKNKPSQVYFSTLKFLREIIEERKKRMTLNQLLLLILRMLIILFTIFAIARPVLKLPFARGNWHPPTAVAFILDTSPSMDYVIDQKTQIQHGLDIIRNIQSEMNERDMSYLLTSCNNYNTIRSRLVHGLLPERDFQDIRFTWTPEPLHQLILNAEQALANSRFLHQEIYVISDIQHTEIPDNIGVPVTFINTFTDTLRINLSTERVSVRKEFIAGRLERIAEFEVVNYSPLPQRDQLVRLSLNGTTVSEKMIDFQPYERQTDYFIINNESLGWNHGWVEIRNDRFIPDNRYFFTFFSDPEPKIGVISDQRTIPQPIQILADIFLGETGYLERVSLETVQLRDIERYHFLIFYLVNYNSRTQALVRELQANNIRSMFILHPNMNETSRQFFLSSFNMSIQPIPNRSLTPISTFHRWHRIVGDFNLNTQIVLNAAPSFTMQLGRNFSPLASTAVAPLVVENGNIFVNMDFGISGQNFITHLSFPILVYRSFSWISRYDSVLNNFAIGDPLRNREGIIVSPSGDEYDPMSFGFRFHEPGIWTLTDTAGKRSIMSVNMSDFENQSSHNPMNIDNINILGTDYRQHVLAQDRGSEIWKILLWAVVIFLAFEMLLVVYLQRKARV